MPIEVIGAGLGRTGTLSLKAALEELGFTKCYHMVEVIARRDDARTWDAAVRAASRSTGNGSSPNTGRPSTCPVAYSTANCWRSTPRRKSSSPCAIPRRWYDSSRQTIYYSRNAFPRWATLLDPRMRDFRRMVDRLWDMMFRGRFEDRAFAIDVFNRHNEQVTPGRARGSPPGLRGQPGLGSGLCNSSVCPSPRGSPSRTSTTPPSSAPGSTASSASCGPSAMPLSARPGWCLFSSRCW